MLSSKNLQLHNKGEIDTELETFAQSLEVIMTIHFLGIQGVK